MYDQWLKEIICQCSFTGATPAPPPPAKKKKNTARDPGAGAAAVSLFDGDGSIVADVESSVISFFPVYTSLMRFPSLIISGWLHAVLLLNIKEPVSVANTFFVKGNQKSKLQNIVRNGSHRKKLWWMFYKLRCLIWSCQLFTATFKHLTLSSEGWSSQLWTQFNAIAQRSLKKIKDFNGGSTEFFSGFFTQLH